MRLVIRAEDKTARVRAKRLGIAVVVSDGWEIDGPTLFANATIPWDLVAAGFAFLERWDAAAPLWRYGVLAEALGSAAERERTREITRDLRLPVYAPELLFVADNEAGRALVETWRRECDLTPSPFPTREGGIDERLAFVRALYLVKPRFCALPRSWLAELEGSERLGRPERLPKRDDHRGRLRHSSQSLVTVQVGPSQFVKCKPGDEAAVLKRYQMMQASREERKRQ